MKFWAGLGVLIAFIGGVAIGLGIVTALVQLAVVGVLINIFGFTFAWGWSQSFGIALLIAIARLLLGGSKND